MKCRVKDGRSRIALDRNGERRVYGAGSVVDLTEAEFRRYELLVDKVANTLPAEPKKGARDAS